MRSITTRRTRIATAVLAASAAASLVPAAAHASFASVGSSAQPGLGGASAPTLLVSGAGNGIGGGSIDEVNSIRITDAGANTFIVTDSASPIRAANGCTQLNANSVRCTGAFVGDVRFYSVFAFGGNDRVDVDSSYLSRGGQLDGGTGNDLLIGGSFQDFLFGRDGSDRLRPSIGNDVVDGGTGTDVADYRERSANLRLSNDGSANDGQQGEFDNIATSVENLDGGSGSDILIGNGGANVLQGLGGNDVLTGGAGADTLRGAAGSDRIFARDGFRDIVDCGTEGDSVSVDAVDVRQGCEVVNP